MQKFRAFWLSEISVFRPKISDFRIWQPYAAQEWLKGHQIFFPKDVGPFWCGPKTFRPSASKRSILGAEISAKSLFQHNFSGIRLWEVSIVPKIIALTDLSVLQPIIALLDQGYLSYMTPMGFSKVKRHLRQAENEIPCDSRIRGGGEYCTTFRLKERVLCRSGLYA